MRFSKLLTLGMVAAMAGIIGGAGNVRGEGELPAIARPQIPERTIEVASMGANGDGKTLNTEAFVKGVAAVKSAGGGTLHVGAGTYLTAPFLLTSHLNLRLDKGATIKLIGFTTGWPQEDGKDLQYGIEADGCTDVAITGEGVIDGQGETVWPRYRKGADASGKMVAPKDLPHRPYLVVLNQCKRVLVEGVTIQNSPMFHLVPRDCEDVTIEGVSVSAPRNAPNTDGMDPSGRNYQIRNCTFDVDDDCIAVKPSVKTETGRPSCENFTIVGCTFKRGHGMSVGGQSAGGMKHMVVRDCTFEGTDAGIRLKSSRIAGGLVEDLTYENLTMKKVKVAIYITSYYPKEPSDPASDAKQAVGDLTPIWKNIRISHVTAEGGETAGIVVGLPEMPIENVTLEDVHLKAKKGMTIVNARGIKFVDSTVEAASGEGVMVKNAEVSGLEKAK